MAYRIEGLSSERFQPLFAMEEEELAKRNARRVWAASDSGYPCRVALEDAKAGEQLLLLNYVSLDAPSPFRTAYAIFVREGAQASAVFEDSLPTMLDSRTLGLRCFDSSAMLVAAELCLPGEADMKVRALFERSDIAEIHAHNAAYGCFLARIERSGR